MLMTRGVAYYVPPPRPLVSPPPLPHVGYATHWEGLFGAGQGQQGAGQLGGQGGCGRHDAQMEICFQVRHLISGIVSA